MISKYHKVVFVHVPKTAGQSLEKLFLDDLGLTWQERAPLLLRHNENPALGPERLAHLYADEYVSLGHLTQAEFDDSYTFSVVRHPYERFVSEFNYRWAGKGKSLDDFLLEEYAENYSDVARHVAPQVRYINNSEGQCLVDDVFTFEALPAAVRQITLQVFGEERALPFRNSSNKSNGIAVCDLSTRHREILYARYEEDFKVFGYDP